jgi:hypothetical protein
MRFFALLGKIVRDTEKLVSFFPLFEYPQKGVQHLTLVPTLLDEKPATFQHLTLTPTTSRRKTGYIPPFGSLPPLAGASF